MPSQLRVLRHYNGPPKTEGTSTGAARLSAVSNPQLGGRPKARPRGNPSGGNRRAVGTVKKSTAIFSPFPQPLENSPLVAPSFPQFPPLLLLASITSSLTKELRNDYFFWKLLENSPLPLRVSHSFGHRILRQEPITLSFLQLLEYNSR